MSILTKELHIVKKPMTVLIMQQKREDKVSPQEDHQDWTTDCEAFTICPPKAIVKFKSMHH